MNFLRIMSKVKAYHEVKQAVQSTFQQVMASLLRLALVFVDVLMTIKPRCSVLPNGTEYCC